MVNVCDLYPKVGIPEINQNIITEFKKSYLQESDSIFVSNEMSEHEMLQIKEVREMAQSLQDENFVFNSRSTFMVVFEHKFSWGLVEVNLNISEGVISECKIYSDCLIPEFIFELENKIGRNNVEYSKNGFEKIRKIEVSQIDESCSRLLLEFSDWMISNLQ